MSVISENAFKDDNSIIKAIFGKKCDNINDSAFENCKCLAEINDDNHIKTIGSCAFKNAKLLSKAKFEHLEKMGSGAFDGCENLTSISLKKCGTIGSGAFKDCVNLEHVYINNPDFIFCELENTNAFKKSENGEIINKNIKFHVNDNVYEKYISDNNWRYYKNNIVGGIRSNQIRYKAKYSNKIDLIVDCDEHTKNNGYWVITFKDDVTSLNQIFTDVGKKRLISIELPYSCKTIKESALSGCERLKTIKMPNVETIEKKAFKGCVNLENFAITDTLKYIGESAFEGCVKLELDNDSLPDNVETIEDSAFENCNLTDVYLPKNLLFLGNHSFSISADNIRIRIHIKKVEDPNTASIPKFTKYGKYDKSSEPFGDDYSKFSIYVPSNLMNKYKQHWFKYIDKFTEY